MIAKSTSKISNIKLINSKYTTHNKKIKAMYVAWEYVYIVQYIHSWIA